jgi:REP element-mobilizing transposase RayT
MKHNSLALYIHLVWSTWDRQPLITPDIERNIHRNLEAEARRMKCTVLAINGTEDHVHMLLSIPTTISLADLLKQLKGVSSHFVNETLKPPFQFKWQGSYGAYTVGERDTQRVIDYIKRQKQHHAAKTLWPQFETTLVELNP